MGVVLCVVQCVQFPMVPTKHLHRFAVVWQAVKCINIEYKMEGASQNTNTALDVIARQIIQLAQCVSISWVSMHV